MTVAGLIIIGAAPEGPSQQGGARRIGLRGAFAPGAPRHEHARHVIFYKEESGGVLITAIIHERGIRHLLRGS